MFPNKKNYLCSGAFLLPKIEQRKNERKMRKHFIPQLEIKNRHPRGMASYTDGDYSNFAVLLMEEIKKARIQDLTSNEQTEIALNLTMYYEDVMADAGIWRGFTDKVHELYGRYLPFYDLDPEKYVRDEPNLEDLQFIIWNTLLLIRFPQGRITNPETPAITLIAEAAYRLMDKWFEEIPVNEELKAFFEEAKFMDSFYDQRDVLKWITYDCYLTHDPDYADEIKDLACDYTLFLNGNRELAHYAAECVFLYTQKTGPLALYAPEWLGIILRANGRKKEALDVERQKLKPFDIFKIEKAEAGKGIEFEDTNGEKFYVTDEGLRNPSPGNYNSKTAIGTFVKYRDAWRLNATVSWSSGGVELFEFTKARVEQEKRQLDFDYDKLMAISGGSPFFYFENCQEMADFLVKEGGISREKLQELDVPDKKRILLVVASKNDLAFQYDKNAECCLKDARNPYYDENIAKEESLSVVLNMPGSALKYAMDHDMLPYASLRSIYGAERGKALVRENYDFFARATMRNVYH